MCNVIFYTLYLAADATVHGRFKVGQPVQYWLDDVQCQGSEQSFFDCQYRQPIGTHNCGRRERAGVHCLSMSLQNIPMSL